MADVKISALPAATTPLAGTEVLPIVQSSTTKKVAISDVTAGRAISASSLTLTTPLTVANGGTGTATAFTAGSVVFAGASGVYSQNNSGLFWDNTNNRLGIGTATPSGILHTYATNGVNWFESPGVSSVSLQFKTNSSNRFRIGIPSASADLAFWSDAGSTEVMRLDTSGNLGLGVTPSAWSGVGNALQVNGAAIWTGGSTANDIYFTSNVYYGTGLKYIRTGYATQYSQYNGQHQWFNAASGTAGTAITFTQAMTLDASGNLGLGATNNVSIAGYTIQTINNGTNGGGVYLQSNGTSIGRILNTTTDMYVGGVSATSKLILQAGGASGATLDASGNLLVGTTNSSVTAGDGFKYIASTNQVSHVISAAGNTYLLYNTTAGAYRFFVSDAGVINATSTTITGISDRRLKENIVDLDVGLDALLALKPRKFDWKSGKGKDIKGDRGWIADEFQQVFPDLIEDWLDAPPEGEEPYKAVRPDLIPVLVKAIQELAAKVQALEAKVA